MNLNVRGYFMLSQDIAKQSMIARKLGPHHQHRVHRRPGRQPARGMKTIAYNTSKGAVINFTRALAC
jgi:NAD(P)-dependent dehydrogenase (short-subunit alcohol dehydrogenase family)